MKNLFLAFKKKYVDGYPIVVDTAPKWNTKHHKVDLNDKNFYKPINKQKL